MPAGLLDQVNQMSDHHVQVSAELTPVRSFKLKMQSRAVFSRAI